MPWRRARILLALSALIALVGMTIVAVPDHHPPRAAVGTEGDGREHDPSVHLTPGVPNEVADVTAGTGPSSTSERAGGTNTTAGDAPTTSAMTSTSVRSSTTTSTTVAPARTLVGRITFTVGQQALWSMRPDGSDRRQEVGCPADHQKFGVMLLALSADGARVLLNCGEPPTGSPTGPSYGVVVADIATGAVHHLSDSSRTDSLNAVWAHDGRRAIISTVGFGGPSRLEVLDTSTGARQPAPAHLAGATSFSGDDTHVLTSDWHLVDVASGASTDLLPAMVGPAGRQLRSATLGPDGWLYWNEITSPGPGSITDTLKRLRLGTTHVEVVHAIDDEIEYLGFLPDGRVFFAHTPIAVVVVDPATHLHFEVPIQYPMFDFSAPNPASLGSAALAATGS